MAFSAGGFRAATCSALKPPQEMPNMPTLPEHHFCLAIQAITSSAHVDADRGIAVTSEVRVRQRIAHVGPVALAVGEVFEKGWNRIVLGILGKPHARGELRSVAGSFSASSGSHMRAASFVPSDSGIQMFSISLTLRGKSVIVVMVMRVL